MLCTLKSSYIMLADISFESATSGVLQETQRVDLNSVQIVQFVMMIVLCLSVRVFTTC